MESQSWDDFRLVDSSEDLGAHPTELPENGLGTLLAWVAGPEFAVSRPTDPTANTTRIEIQDSAGQITRTREERSAEEMEIVDESIAEYVTSASVPAPPPSRTWMILTARQAPKDWLESVQDEVFESLHPDASPGDVLDGLRRVLPPRLLELGSMAGS